MYSHAKILIVDDQNDNIQLLTHILEQQGYSQIMGLYQSTQTVRLVRDWNPDIVLLDLMMPVMDGYDVLAQLQGQLPADAFLPVLILTADHSPSAREKALTLGAHDFVSRPFEVFDITLRVRNLLHARFLHLELQSRNDNLESLVRERTKKLEDYEWELKEAQLEVIERLGRCGEYRDEDTGLHTYRVARHCRHLAQQMNMSADEVEVIRRAAPLHDVGKIGISDTILLKPGRLTEEEFRIMQTHTEIGARLLAGGNSELVTVAERIALSHHERWDGTGYPNKLAGRQIPIEARILAVADVFDALTHERPYKDAWPVDRAEEEIIRQRERQFDPEVVEAFQAIRHEMLV